MQKHKLVFIGTSVMMSKCIEIASKKFKNIFIITQDKKIKKKFGKKFKFISYKKLKQIKPDYLFSILNNKILSKSELASIQSYSLNFHDGPLPKYAGMFSSTWAIFNNEKNHGVCWHKIENKIDTGDILEEKKFNIEKNDTAYNIDTKGTLIGIDLFKKIIKNLVKKKLTFKKQNKKKRSFFKKSNLRKIINSYKKNGENKIILRSLALSPQKLKILNDTFRISIDINKLKKENSTKNKKMKKFDMFKVDKLINFLNKTIQTNFKLKNGKNNLSDMALNNHYKWDSLSHVKLLSAIEKKFRISINEKNIDNFSNLEHMMIYFNKKKLI